MGGQGGVTELGSFRLEEGERGVSQTRILRLEGSRVISRNMKLGGYGQMFGGWCKHAGSVN